MKKKAIGTSRRKSLRELRIQQSISKKKAVKLFRNKRFLYRACREVGRLGVVGEKRNRLVLILAGIARTLRKPPSVLIKGETSCGKTTLVKMVLKLFPRRYVMERVGLSKKALAHGKGSFANKILFIHEYRCGKDAQLLLRLLQSEGSLVYEYTA